MSKRVLLTSLGICLLAAACEMPRPGNDVVQQDATQDVQQSDIMSLPDVTPEASPDVTETEASAPDASDDAADAAMPVTCPPAATDFQPRTAMASWAAPWNMCMAVTNANTYPYFSASAAAPGRVRDLGALEGAGNFFDPTRDPSPAEFTITAADAGTPNSAGDLFLRTGIETRYQRRADEHYAAPMGLALNSAYQDYCNTMASTSSDYCAGPNSLFPVYGDAFTAGRTGMPAGIPSRVHAAKIHGTYQWWLFISSYKESLTCAPVAADCDSAAGYYMGTSSRNDAMQYGLARELLSLGDAGRAAHDRIWDGLLAMRCWRALDGAAMLPATSATNEMLREQARLQLDRALTRGMVMIVQARLRAFASTDGNPARALERQAHAAWIGVVGPLLANGLERWSRGWWASQRASASMAVVTRVITELRAENPNAMPPTQITTTQAGRASADLEALFPCP